MNPRDRSGFAQFLFLSGLLGIAVAMAVVAYQVALQDPILLGGRRVPPTWTATVFTTTLGGSVAVLVYAAVMDDVLRGWYDVVTGAAFVGQWGAPAGTFLTRESGITGLTGFAMLLSSCLAVLVAVALVGNYARRCWPRIGGRIAAVLPGSSRN